MEVASPAELRDVVKLGKKYCNRRNWRRAVLLRQTRIALTLRAIEHLLGSRLAGRKKTADRKWAVSAFDGDGILVLAVLVGGGETRTVEQLRAPIRVEVIAPHVLDAAVLGERVRRSGDAKETSK